MRWFPQPHQLCLCQVSLWHIEQVEGLKVAVRHRLESTWRTCRCTGPPYWPGTDWHMSGEGGVRSRGGERSLFCSFLSPTEAPTLMCHTDRRTDGEHLLLCAEMSHIPVPPPEAGRASMIGRHMNKPFCLYRLEIKERLKLNVKNVKHWLQRCRTGTTSTAQCWILPWICAMFLFCVDDSLFILEVSCECGASN